MAKEPKTLMVFGIGKVGGPVVDLLATRYPQHKYVMVSRSADRAERRVNLTRYVCSQWGQYPDLQWETTDLLSTERTAEIIDRQRPDVVFNATTPFPWWVMDTLPEHLRRLTYSAGLGMWCALDCLLPMKLGEALDKSTSKAIYVNGCYPDMVNAFLRESTVAPRLGIGNMSNLVPGLRLTFAKSLGVHPKEIVIHLVCHHFTSLNAPSVGGASGAPYHLTVDYPTGQLTFDGTDDSPFAMLKADFSRVRGLEGQGVTISSATTVLATLLNGQRRLHHAPGPLGLVGGYPVLISEDGTVGIDLPPELQLSDAVAINTNAQQFDGLQEVRPGMVELTDAARSALLQIVGINLPTVTKSNVLSLSREIVSRLNAQYAMELNL